jgi:hypothetical protein
MLSDAGFFGRPGIVMISPDNTTMNPAPAFRYTSRTLNTWPVGGPCSCGSVENEYCVFAMQIDRLPKRSLELLPVKIDLCVDFMTVRPIGTC